MDTRTTSIIGYMTWIGLIVALCIGDRYGAKFHLNQALVIFICAFLSFIPFVGWIFSIFVFICWVIGLIAAINQEERQVPIIGAIKLLR